jgi:hypothetical protein
MANAPNSRRIAEASIQMKAANALEKAILMNRVRKGPFPRVKLARGSPPPKVSRVHKATARLLAWGVGVDADLHHATGASRADAIVGARVGPRSVHTARSSLHPTHTRAGVTNLANLVKIAARAGNIVKDGLISTRAEPRPRRVP